MTDQSIFNNDNSSPQGEGDQGKNEPTPADQLLSEIVNSEGKQKYGSVEEALKGLGNAQEHIRRLEEENSDFKQGAEKSATLQDVLDAMKPDQGEPSSNEEVAQLGEGDIAKVLEDMLAKRETASSQKANTTKVANKFVEVHGAEEAEAKYYEAAASLGFSKAEINELSARNPDAVFKMLGVNAEKEPTPNSLKGDVNAGEFNQQKPDAPRFNPFQPGPNSDLAAWRKSKEQTNSRLELD